MSSAKKKKKIEKLKRKRKVQQNRSLKRRTIYIWSTESLYNIRKKAGYKPIIKVGDTFRDVDGRIDETDSTGVLETPIKLATRKLPIGKRDYNIHKILQEILGVEKSRHDKRREGFLCDIDMVFKAIQILKTGKFNKGLLLTLHTFQEDYIDEILEKLNDDDATANILLHLCARFGKTIFVLKLFIECMKKFNKKVLILPSYYLSSLQSFKSDIQTWSDFNDMVFIDDKEDPNTIHEVLASGKLPVLGVSVCGDDDGKSLKEVNKVLKTLNPEETMIYVDEADYGISADNTEQKVKKILKNSGSTINLFGTGTNIHKVAMKYKADYKVVVSYINLLMAKKEGDDTLQEIPGINKFDFDISTKFVKEFQDEVGTTDLNPDWAKICNDPERHRGVWMSIIKTFFMPSSEMLVQSHMNIPERINDITESTLDQRVIQAWLPHGIKNENMNVISRYFEEVLKDHYVIDCLNGDETTMKLAEKRTKDKIKSLQPSHKGLIILSSIIGARSYSVPELDTVVIMYDRGSEDNTIQKMSRGCTRGTLLNGDKKEMANIVTLSFDSNRITALESLAIEAAKDLQEASEVEETDFNEFVKIAIDSLNFYALDAFGQNTKIEKDNFLEQALKDKALSEQMTPSFNLESILSKPDLVSEILRAELKKSSSSREETLMESGKRYEKAEKEAKEAKEKNEENEETLSKRELLEKLKVVVNNTEIIKILTPTIEKAPLQKRMEIIESIDELNKYYFEIVGLSPALIIKMIKSGDLVPNNADIELN